MNIGELVECAYTDERMGIVLEVHNSKSAVHPYFIYWFDSNKHQWHRPESLKETGIKEIKQLSICS